MIVFLLAALLVLGDVEPHASNVTAGEELSGAENSTGTAKPDSGGDGGRRPSGRTPVVIGEDDESFQNQDTNFWDCDGEALVELSHGVCGAAFHAEMAAISSEHWCDLEHVSRPYNHMSTCLETLSALAYCFYPNPDIQDFFLHIHSLYFQRCDPEEVQLADPPQEVLVGLTLLPVALVPLLVYLVACKSKVQE